MLTKSGWVFHDLRPIEIAKTPTNFVANILYIGLQEPTLLGEQRRITVLSRRLGICLSQPLIELGS
jgi:hypothetical protein